jgi:hypothetical protein
MMRLFDSAIAEGCAAVLTVEPVAGAVEAFVVADVQYAAPRAIATPKRERIINEFMCFLE